MRAALLASLHLVTLCQTPASQTPAPDAMPKNEEPTQLHSLTDPSAASPEEEAKDPYAPTYGNPVTREARYVLSPVAGSKRLQAGSLEFDDGESWIVSYRPIRAHFQFVDKRVRVRGRPYWSSPMVQSVGATHFELESIELAPGETPYDPIPTEIPPPPQVRTIDELRSRLGRWRWCHAIGTLTELIADPESRFRRKGRMKLTDGEIIGLINVSNSDETFDQLVGQEVTILARLVGNGDKEPLALSAATICPGVVERCRMTLDNTRDP